MQINNLAILFLLIIVYKIILNIYRYIKCVRLETKYVDFFQKNKTQNLSYKAEIEELFKFAGVKDAQLPISQPTGLGQCATFNVSSIENMFVPDKRTLVFVLDMFTEAKGVFRKRIIEAINPIYWIQTIIFLPQKIVDYLGGTSDAIATKLLQLLWWIICPAAIIFRDKITTILINLFNHF